MLSSCRNKGEVSFQDYRQWVLANPHVMVFFNQVSLQLKKMILLERERVAKKAAQSEENQKNAQASSFKNKSPGSSFKARHGKHEA